jgi:hypothetical protein
MTITVLFTQDLPINGKSTTESAHENAQRHNFFVTVV